MKIYHVYSKDTDLYYPTEEQAKKFCDERNSESNSGTIYEYRYCVRDTEDFDTWESLISFCEELRKTYNETKDSRYLLELIRLLPNTYKVVKL